MATEVLLPKLGLSLEPGRIVAWHKQPGDQVSQGETIVEVETDKATMDVEAPAGGVLLACFAESGDTVDIGATIGVIGGVGEELPPRGERATPSVTEKTVAPSVRAEARRPVAAGTDKVRASPIARRRARELGVNLAQVVATGPGGRVTTEDVEAHAALKTRAHAGPRAGIAAQVVASWSAPHINICGELVVDGLLRALHSPALESAMVSVTDLLAHAVASALRQVPELNGTYVALPVRAAEVHLGVAVATERGVTVPVIHNAGELDIEGISQERRRLTDAARAGSLAGTDLVGGTATLSNLGGYPVDLFTPVLFGPQICLVATGRIRSHPVVKSEAVAVEHRIWVNVCIDHRAADGDAGGRLLAALEEGFASLG